MDVGQIQTISGVTVKKSTDRKTVLLKACLDMLTKANDSGYVLDVMSTTVHYDEADCDGHCLMDDIKMELEEQP